MDVTAVRVRSALGAVLLASGVALSGCTMLGVPAAHPPADPAPAEPSAGAEPPPAAPVGPRPREREPEVGPRREGRRGPIPTPFHETRAVWVVRSSLVDPAGVREMVAHADRAGINTLLVQVRGRGDAYYRSALEPRAEALEGRPATFDPLALVLDEAHQRGMAVHAWVNTHLVWGSGPPPDDPSHVVRARPELLAVPRALGRELYRMDPAAPAYVEALRSHAAANRETVEGLYTNPAAPAVREHIAAVWLDLARRYPLDGLHFDYVRYPGPQYDYSRGGLEAFRAWAEGRVDGRRATALDRAARRDPLAWPDGEPELFADFRRAQITELVERVTGEVRAERSELVVSAAVFADPADAYGARYQDWRDWLRRGLIDVAVPMAYAPDDDVFRLRIRQAVEAAGDPRRVWAGIGAYLTGYDGTVGKIAIARGLGAGGVSLFSYGWAAGEGEGPGGADFLEAVGQAAFGGR